MRARGFTLVELVVVTVILGILSITILPRFTDRTGVYQSGFTDQVRTAIQHARKTAIANRRYVCVTTTSSGLSLRMDPRLPDGLTSALCTVNVNIPGTSGNSIGAPSGVTLSPSTTFYFDALGRASSSPSITIAGQTITVEQETGYVH